jgi:hypothetical protein
VRAVALGGERGARLGERRQCREDRRQLAHVGGVERAQPVRIELRELLVERVYQHRVREVALELLRAAGEHEHAALRCAGGELREQSRLADPRLARQLQHAHVPAVDVGEQRLQSCLLLDPADRRRRREPCRHGADANRAVLGSASGVARRGRPRHAPGDVSR